MPEKEAVSSTGKLIQYCQLPDKNSSNTWVIFWIFCNIAKFLCVYSMISHGTIWHSAEL